MLRTILLLSCIAIGFPQPGQSQDHTEHSEHIGKETREIKSLSDERIDALTNGGGAGYALPAELNHYPGPTHVLDLKTELSLTTDQHATISEIFQSMNLRAKELGHQLLNIERTMEKEFQAENITHSRLEGLTASASRLDGMLRYVHLSAHIETQALLTSEQIDLYDQLRGYTFDGIPN